jgi:hypothetical protein
MAQVRSWAGLDVHARSVVAVTVDGISGERPRQSAERPLSAIARSSTGSVGDDPPCAGEASRVADERRACPRCRG